MKPNDAEVKEALARVHRLVSSSGNDLDLKYFEFHKDRYLKMARSVAARSTKGASILNIGSHYLHTSLLFSFLGYEVSSMDVSVFWDLDFVSTRADNYDVIRIVENDLESLNSQTDVSDKYDIVLFAEILEHITFNPILFWKRIYSIIKSDGMIYISTPNSLNLYNMLRTLGRVLMFRGVGLPIGSIFQNVTYGHHWKEYSASEIQKYFAILSDDFKVKSSMYSYRNPDFRGFYSSMMTICSLVGNSLYFTSDEIEAIVTVKKTGNWRVANPKY